MVPLLLFIFIVLGAYLKFLHKIILILNRQFVHLEFYHLTR